MAPLPKKTIQNFIHRHPLKEVWASTRFLCDGCRTPGSGTRYRCEPCDFDLHLHCANSPEPKETIKHFLHRHPLTEYSSGRRGFHCDGCGTPVTGTWYRCEQCDFDLHRDCADSPEEVSFFLHPHPLRLTPFMPRHYCNLCRDHIVGLFYRCERCDFDLHLHCYHGCGVSSSSPPRTGGGSSPLVQGSDREKMDYLDRLGLNLLVSMLGGGPFFSS